MVQPRPQALQVHLDGFRRSALDLLGPAPGVVLERGHAVLHLLHAALLACLRLRPQPRRTCTSSRLSSLGISHARGRQCFCVHCCGLSSGNCTPAHLIRSGHAGRDVRQRRVACGLGCAHALRGLCSSRGLALLGCVELPGASLALHPQTLFCPRHHFVRFGAGKRGGGLRLRGCSRYLALGCLGGPLHARLLTCHTLRRVPPLAFQNRSQVRLNLLVGWHPTCRR
mmetsp:Transcript_76207/g.236776  ORF Transcript_76207/g.236776 Transcript_76207/m.236776 type:complete len:226 (+) Transcript_76207:426-1103(+)